ncbi:MAG: Ig-like domain-containing protein [Actinomycetota bacterium]|nr:Ig-like domain-containing protein [Actinomycetota bacterium]
MRTHRPNVSALHRALTAPVVLAMLVAGALPARAEMNGAPDAVRDTVDATSGESKTIDVLNNDSDPEDDSIMITAVSVPLHGTATFNLRQEVIYTSERGYAGSDSFTYTIEDDFGGTDTATVAVTVSECGGVGDAMDDDGIVVGEEWINCSSTNANEVAGDDTPVTNPTNGTQVLLTNGHVQNAAPPNTDTATGTDNQTSHRGAHDVSVLKLDLDIPLGSDCLALDLAFQTEEYPENISSPFNDGFIAELDSSTWIVEGSTISAPDNFAFDGAGNIVSVNSSFFEPDRVVVDTGTEYDGSTSLLDARTPVTPGAHTLYLSIFDATDGQYDSGVYLDRLRAFDAADGKCFKGARQAPTAKDDVLTTDEDTPGSVNVLSNDVDLDGDPISVISNTNGSNGTVSCGETTCTYTPNAHFNGTDTFTYRVSDGTGADTGTVTVTVNPVEDPPNALDDSVGTAEDSGGTFDVLANDVDPDGDVVTITSNTNATNGTVSCTLIDCSYTGNANFNGTDSFTYTIADGKGGTDTATVGVRVVSVNDAPQAAADSLSAAEDSPATVIVNANDTDVDGDALSVSSSTDGADGTVSCLGGSCTYTPRRDFFGTDSFTYTISDGNGGSAEATVSVTVEPAPDVPTARDDTLTTPEDTEGTVNVLANDEDPDGDAISITSNTNGANGSVICGASSCTYTPAPNFNGTDSFTYSISDGIGDAQSATVSVTVSSVNDAPDASGDSMTTDEDQPTSLDVLLNDSDVEGHALAVSSSTNGTNGTVTCSAGSCTYTPAPNFNGTDSFTYTVTDGPGGSDTATVQVSVAPVPDAPNAIDDLLEISEDSVGSVNVFSNDSDADGDQLSISANTNGAKGSATCSGNSCTYTPQSDSHGSDSFTYTISDGQGGTDTATVAVEVASVNDPPVASADSVSTTEDTPADIDVLANDSDVEGHALSVTSRTNGAKGTVACSASSCTYTPSANSHGSDSFTYTVADGNGGRDTATVDVTVSSVNDNPSVADDSATTIRNTSKTINVLSNDADVDGDSLAITDETAGPNGGVSCSVDSCTYTPAPDFIGSDSFTYTVGDGNGGSATATVNVTVNEPNVAPTAGATPAEGAQINEGGSVSFGSESSSDPDGQIESYSWTVNDGRTFTGPSPTISFGDNGSFDVKLEVCDNEGACDDVTVTVGVANVNPAATFSSQPSTPLRINTNTPPAKQGGVQASFSASASDPAGAEDQLTYEWAFGDGTSSPASSSASVSHAYKTLGSYKMTLTVRDEDGGAVSVTSRPVKILPIGKCGTLQKAYWGKPGVKATVAAKTQFWMVKGTTKKPIKGAYAKPGQVVKLQPQPRNASEFQWVCINKKRYMRVEKVTRSLPNLKNEYLPESALLRLP